MNCQKGKNFIMIALMTFVIGMSTVTVNDAFAGTIQPEHDATLPSALVNYVSSTNEVNITWQFYSLSASEKCAIKGDFSYSDDSNDDPLDADKHTGFLPRFYTPTYDPTGFSTGALQSIDNSDTNVQGEIIPCTGKLTIDIDDILGDAKNINSRVGVELFISFYIATASGEFQSADDKVIDEVFVLYAPNQIMNQDTVEWACGSLDPDPDNQIAVGNVLFIDQSGIRGTGGPDNCDTTLEFEDGEYCCIFPTQTTTTVNGGGSNSEHKTRPTFGLDHQTFAQLVINGLTINDRQFTVTDNYWTDIPMQNLEVGVMQNFTAKSYAPYNVQKMEYVFGIPGVGYWQDGEASILLEMGWDGEIIEPTIKNPKGETVINPNSLSYSHADVQCEPTDPQLACQKFSVEFSFNEAPIGNVLALQAIDFRHRSQITYFNDGINLNGDSLNVPQQKQIISDIKNKGMQTVQRIDRENNIWISLERDEPVFKYQQNSVGSFIPIEWKQVIHKIDQPVTSMDRAHSDFTKLVAYETNRATETFDSAQIQGVMEPIFAYDFPEESLRMDKLASQLYSENIRAEQYYDGTHDNYPKH